MVYRLAWVAGIAGIGLALARAERLLRPSAEGLPWEVILVAATVLGATITWTGVAYRLSGRAIAAVNLVAAGLTMIRVAVPATTWFVFPTRASFGELQTEMTFAGEVIRSGVAPVLPLAGIVAILAVVFWGMGALLAWGLLAGRPYGAVLTPLVVYLEFAVMDRRPGGWWTTFFMVALGFSLISVALDRRREGTGLLTSGVARFALVRSLPSLGAVTLAVTLFVAVTASDALAGLVPRSGYLDWRSSSGLSGEYYGSVSYNPFVGIRQSLVSSTNVPVFVAGVQGDLPGERLYWRLVTLDSFDGAQWHIGKDANISQRGDLEQFETAEMAFRGETSRVVADVTILALQMEWLPAPYAPVSFSSDNRTVDRSLRVREEDGSLRFDALTYRGMTYQVAAQVPEPDLEILSRRADGSVSVVFESAIAGNEFEIDDTILQIEAVEVPDSDHYLEFPDDLDPGIGRLARIQTAGLETDFEKALALETFFRTPGNFSYSTAIVPGHGASNLAAWLLDPESDNFRTGYCEQFATGMAVMARTIGIPSRVVLGFTPGTRLEDGRMVVRDRNAHAWVELWMPTQGWVKFDPTPRGDGVNPATTDELPFRAAQYLEVDAAQSPPATNTSPGGTLFRDDELDDIPPIGVGGGSTETVPIPEVPRWTMSAFLAAVAAFGLLPAFKWLRRRRRLRRLERGDVTAAWREIIDRLSDLGDAPEPWTTPLEVAEGTDPALRPLAEVYGESLYGPVGSLTAGRVALATRSLGDVEARLAGRYPLGRRILARYRLRSVTPSWWRRVRARRKRETRSG